MLSEWRDVLYNELYAKKSEVRASEKSLVDALHQIITTSFSKPVSEYGCSAPFNFGDNSEIKTVNDFIYELDVSGIPHVKSCILEGVTPEELIKALLEARKTVEEYLPTVTIKKYVSRNPETDIYKRTIELGFNPDCPSFLSDYKRVQDIEQLIPDDNSNFFSDYVSRDENGFFRINDSMSQEEFEATVTNTIRKRK